MKRTLKYYCFFALCFLLNISVQADSIFAQQPNERITKVHVVFKTHLDIGFTQLSSKVEQRYVGEFIPKAIAVAEQLRNENGEARYVWTTGSWLVSEYLQKASSDAVKKLEEAISKGDIVWNGVPYTVESEIMSKDLFETILKLSQQLDNRFGKKTVAAKMTDVPGHTRGIITPLSDAGIRFLHIGVNPASALPDVPDICRWRNTDGKEIILMYQKDYGGDIVLPDGHTAFSLKFTGDNHGPHSADQVKEIFASLKKKYPNAKITASTLDDVYRDLQKNTNDLPVVTSEIGDTWIRGYASSPLKIARFKALSRLYSEWIKDGKINKDDPDIIKFAVRLALVAEHTWGMDIKTHLKNWDKYDVDVFNQSRDLPEFKLVEQSWAEQDAYIDQAIAFLPDEKLKTEAQKAIAGINIVEHPDIDRNDVYPGIDNRGAITFSTQGMNMFAGELTYQTFSSDDFNKFYDSYLRSRPDWAIADFGKPGLEKTKAKSAIVVADMVNCNVIKESKQTTIQCQLKFPGNSDIDPRILPGSMSLEYIVSTPENQVEMTLTLRNKPANRLPEAYYLSFLPSDIKHIIAEKMGYEVDVMDVVPGGNRQMYAIDNCIDLITDKGTFRITSLDAPIVCIGEKNALNYSKNQPDIRKGIHFCLFNNLWGTNFSMWFGGSIKYRFKIVKIISINNPIK